MKITPSCSIRSSVVLICVDDGFPFCWSRKKSWGSCSRTYNSTFTVMISLVTCSSSISKHVQPFPTQKRCPHVPFPINFHSDIVVFQTRGLPPNGWLPPSRCSPKNPRSSRSCQESIFQDAASKPQKEGRQSRVPGGWDPMLLHENLEDPCYWFID